MDTTTSDPLAGQVLDGRYRLDARIARGGMATVYRGFDTRLDRVIAIKVMHASLAEDDNFVERFRREAKSAAALSHPNVVGIYDQGEDDGKVYLVMELVSGRTLRALLRERGQLEPAEALDIMDGVLSALGAAHAAGIVHRDVKPENVLLTEDHTVKVADFGLARAVTATSQTMSQGVLIGTVAYLAPEQVVSGVADQRTDLYSAGIVLYEALTGSAPFVGDAPIAIAYRHVNEDVPNPSNSVPDLPPAVDELVLRATERDPEARYGSAGEMQAALRGARVGVPEAEHITRVVPLDDAPTTVIPLPAKPPRVKRDRRTPPVGPRPPRGKRGLIVALVVLLVLASAGAVGWWYGSGRYQDAPNLLNLDLQAATSLAQQTGVEVAEGEGAWSDTVAKGLVVDQDPDPGARVREGGTVTLHLSLGPRVVPDVAGKTVDEAIAILDDAGIEVSANVPQNSISVAKDRVIGTDPTKGSTLRGATSVRLLVSAGPKAVKVPDVVGKTESQAVSALHAVGLKVTATRAYDDDAPIGEVIGQNPPKGTDGFENDTVTITVSKGPETTLVPDLFRKKRAEVIQLLDRAGLQAAFTGFSSDPSARCLRQNPEEGTTVRRGSTVTCQMF